MGEEILHIWMLWDVVLICILPVLQYRCSNTLALYCMGSHIDVIMLWYGVITQCCAWGG